jgi:tRNA dimethylallyltransferase
MIIITGPTASGKTGLSVALAKKYNGEIISADSMQVYRHMDIGTAKPTLEERQGIIHHLMDVVDPWETFTVAQFQTLATQAIEDSIRRGKTPILVGGTGLYINALVRGWSFSNTPPSDEVRQEIRLFYEKEGKDALHQALEQVDPVSAGNIHPNNVKRVMRALEVHRASGIPKSTMDEASLRADIPYDYTLIGLTMDRKRLYHRIDERVDIMMERGLVEEVKKLTTMGADRTWQSMQGLGYKEILAHLDGECTLDEAVTLLKRDTRHYAKRQWTWFRRLEETRWVDLDDLSGLEETLHHIEKFIEKKE